MAIEIIQFLSTAQVAQALGLTSDSVRRLVREGKLKTLPHRGTERLRFTAQMVNDYIMEGTREQ